MEENLKKTDIRAMCFEPDMTEAEAGSYSPLALAFQGDAFYELAVRTMLLSEGNARPHDASSTRARSRR